MIKSGCEIGSVNQLRKLACRVGFVGVARMTGLLLFTSMALASCGNKGDLFLPADQEMLDQLVKAEQAIEETTADKPGKKPQKK